MARPKLTPAMRTSLITWLAAEHTEGEIRAQFAELGWPQVSAPTMAFHRKRVRHLIAARRAGSLNDALESGLALKAERVRRLVEHAETLGELKWVQDEHGRLLHEKAWRETLQDIAKEMGHRRQGMDLFQTFGKMTDAELDDYITAGEAERDSGAVTGTLSK